MSDYRRVRLVCAFVLVAGLAGSIWSVRKADPIVERIALSEVLYIPSPRTVKAMSLGYSGLLADIYWTRVVQYFGNKHLQSPDSYKLLAPLLDTTTTLDPQLDIAYQFGAFFLAQKPPEGAGSPDEAVVLVKKGIAANPEKWRLYYNLGYVYWMEKGDPKAASEAFEAGSRIPGALPWMKVMAGAMAQGANDLQTAKRLWTEVLKDATQDAVRWNAQRHLMSIESDEAVMALQQRADFFRERTGRIPTMQDLIASGLLREVPLDPTGTPYHVNSFGEVVVANRRELPFITRGLPRGEKPKPIFNLEVARKQPEPASSPKSSGEAGTTGPAARPTPQHHSEGK